MVGEGSLFHLDASVTESETVMVVVVMMVTGDTSEFVLQLHGRQNVTGINSLACSN